MQRNAKERSVAANHKGLKLYVRLQSIAFMRTSHVVVVLCCLCEYALTDELDTSNKGPESKSCSYLSLMYWRMISMDVPPSQ